MELKSHSYMLTPGCKLTTDRLMAEEGSTRYSIGACDRLFFAVRFVAARRLVSVPLQLPRARLVQQTAIAHHPCNVAFGAQ